MKITEESMKNQAGGLEDSRPGRDTAQDATQDTGAGTKKSEKEKLASMSHKDRIWYIWSYYKFHIIGAIVAVVLAANIGAAFYRSTFDTALHCIYLNSRSETEVNTAPLEQDFAGYLKLGKKELVSTEISYISFEEETTDYSYAAMAKITALVAAHDLDILIGDGEGTEHYASLDGFMDLEEALPPDLLLLVQDRLYYAPDSSGEPYACAIDLSQTAFADDSNLAQDPPLLGIISNSKRTQAAEALVRYIFQP